MSQLDPSVGGCYATGQFGKNHVGDRNNAPTVQATHIVLLRQIAITNYVNPF